MGKNMKRISVFLLTAVLIVSSLPVITFASDTCTNKNVRVGYFTMENFMEGGADGTV